MSIDIPEEQEKGEFGLFAVVAAVTMELTYFIPDSLPKVVPGSFCLVPLWTPRGINRFVAFFRKKCEKPEFPCFYVEGIVPGTLPLSPPFQSFLEWVAEYYLFPFERLVPILAPSGVWKVEQHSSFLAAVARLHLPAQRNSPVKRLRKPKGSSSFSSAEQTTHVSSSISARSLLSQEQEEVCRAIKARRSGVCLLHGVTGAGKTEVYLQLASETLAAGRSVLVLVPEIALTPQMSARFRSRFGENLAVLHSGLSRGEYMREWLRVHHGQASMVLGVRSSVFTSLKDIGLIIVDEEHDGSYKATGCPAYHARDVAVLRATREGALCVLGSATPSVESFHNVALKKYSLHLLKNRYSGQKVDTIVVDARQELGLLPRSSTRRNQTVPLHSSRVSFERESLSPYIHELLKENVDRGGQSMVILNRRGYFSYVICSSCSTPLMCPSCSVTTTLHEGGKLEICHYCNFKTRRRAVCPSCSSRDLVVRGVGTQNIEERLRMLVPGLRVDRLDRDVMTSGTRLSAILERFRLRQTDCLVGTQMLAKGHDFPGVTLVVILHVEDALFLPDFRAGERAFQLLTQAMGRAGRGSSPGKVVLQSLVPGHPVIEMALTGKIEDFFQRELQLRQMGFLPPFSRQILLEFRHRNLATIELAANRLRDRLIEHWKMKGIPPGTIRLAGPHPAIIERIQNEHRLQICISSERSLHPSLVFPVAFAKENGLSSLLRVEVDPLSFL